MANSAQLNIQVTNTGVDTARTKLKKLNDQAGKTERGTNSLKSGFVELGRDAARGVALIDGPLGGVSSRIGAFTSLLGSTATGIGLVTAAATAAAAGLSAMSISAASAVRETSNMARVSGMTVSEFGAASIAAKQYGVDVGKLSDSFKDAKERIGEFIGANGTGALNDYADVMGLTKKEALELAVSLSDLSGRDVLQTLVSNMQAAGKSTDEMSFALEGMASDLTLLLPLLVDNGAELQRLEQRFSEIESPLTEQEIQDYRDLSENVDLAASSISQLVQKALVPMIPVVSEAAKWVAELASGFGELIDDTTVTEDFDKALDLMFQIGDLQDRLDRIGDGGSARLKKSIKDRIAALTEEREALLGSAKTKSNIVNQEIMETYDQINAAEVKRQKTRESALDNIDAANREAQAQKLLAAQLRATAMESGFDVDTQATTTSTGIITSEESDIERLTRQRDLVSSYQDLGIGDLQAHGEALLILDAQIAEARYEQEQAAAYKRKELRDQELEAETKNMQAYAGLFGAVGESFGSIASVISSSTDEASDAYAAMFAISKGFAVAQASLNFSSALMQALSLPSDVTLADKFASYAAVLAAGTSVLSTISGISYAGRLQGGTGNAGETYIAGERGPELVTFGRDGGSVSNNKQTTQQGSSGSQKTNYTIVNQTSGQINNVEEQRVSESDVVLIIKETMPGEIANANSSTSKSLSKNTSTTRKLR